MYDAERGLVDLRQGRLLYVAAKSGGARGAGAVVAAVDGVSRLTLDQMRRLSPTGSLRLVVTSHRARVMGAASDMARGLSISLNGTNAPDEILGLAAAPGAQAAALLDAREATDAERGGLLLARLARLLPSIVSVPLEESDPQLRELINSGAALTATTEQIDALVADARVELIHVSSGPVPLEEAENAQFLVFRELTGMLEHVAVVVGDPDRWPDPLPVRLHSACLTGDLFGSLRCDCGEQLRGALRIFAESGGGVLIYLAQEGRGIGLGNKLRAYVLQEDGHDTIDADGALGFGADERRYHVAVQILRHLRVGRVQLLTNNPEKLQALRDGGIDVADRRPLFGRLNRHNFNYVSTKVHRAGHWLTEMLSSAVPGK
jgi:GTP cyclohydrolase II